MLVTIVSLMYEAFAWLRRWRSALRCMQLTYQHLDHHSPCSLVLSQSQPDRDGTSLFSELLTSVTGNRQTASMKCEHLWSDGSQQLAVFHPQV